MHLQQEWPQQWQLPAAFHDNVYMVQENETPYRVPIREEEQLEHVRDRVNMFYIATYPWKSVAAGTCVHRQSMNYSSLKRGLDVMESHPLCKRWQKLLVAATVHAAMATVLSPAGCQWSTTIPSSPP